MHLTLLDDPEAVSTLLGHAEIGDWIRRRCAADNTTFQVTCRWIDTEEMMVTEECRRPDGTFSLTASTARVCQAQIITQSVVGLHAN